MLQNFESRDGDYTEVVPPVPIPNTEVKCLKADGSRKARVGSPHLCIQSLSLWPVGLARGDAYLYNMGMRGLVSKRKFAIGTVVVLFLLSLNLISSQVREFVTSVSSPLQVSLWQAGKNISTFFGGGSLRTENEVLRQENFSLMQKVISLQDVESENEELRRMLELGLVEEFRMAMAEVIGKNLGEDVITIRGGQNQGIQKGMPVIASGTIAVGKVVESFSDHARVQLISADAGRTDAQIAGTETTGVVRGEGGQKLMLDLVPQEDELGMGDIVVTSNLGGVFPKNLLIGEITEILKAGADPFQKANVKPFFSLKSLETVFVITSLASPDLLDLRP